MIAHRSRCGTCSSLAEHRTPDHGRRRPSPITSAALSICREPRNRAGTSRVTRSGRSSGQGRGRLCRISFIMPECATTSSARSFPIPPPATGIRGGSAAESPATGHGFPRSTPTSRRIGRTRYAGYVQEEMIAFEVAERLAIHHQQLLLRRHLRSLRLSSIRSTSDCSPSFMIPMNRSSLSL